MMLSIRAVFYIFLIIFVEGYIVLSSELLAIRTLVPYVGSGTDTVSIIIAAVLLPLAAGYFSGGQWNPSRNGAAYNRTVRKKLGHNIFVATIFLVLGLSFFSNAIIIEILMRTFSTDRLVITSLFSLFFLVIPVYLLGQTTPLLSNFFSEDKLSETTGKILFVSTIGSFIGATFTTLIFMSYIGVHNTVTINIVLASLLLLSLSYKFKKEETLIKSALLVMAALFLNSNSMLKNADIVENNTYNLVMVKDIPEIDYKVVTINGSTSSGLNSEGKPFEYVQFIEDTFINQIPPERQPANILILGAGGFTIGLNDHINHYDFVDIDKTLLSVAENHFLNGPLNENKEFHPLPARGYLNSTDKKYDLILVDVFFSQNSIPEHLVTREFLMQVRNALKPDGIFTANVIADPMGHDAFSVNIDATMRSVFPDVRSQIVPKNYSPWKKHGITNLLYYSGNSLNEETGSDNTRSIYTDNLNRSYKDRPRNVTNNAE